MAEAPELIRIVNTVRSPHTRMHRAKSASRHRFKMYIGGQRLLRKRSIIITREVFDAELSNLTTYMAEGKIALVMSDGMKITQTIQGQYVLTRADGAIKLLPEGELPSCFRPTEPKVLPPEVVEEAIEEAGGMDKLLEEVNKKTPAETFEEALTLEEAPAEVMGLTDEGEVVELPERVKEEILAEYEEEAPEVEVEEEPEVETAPDPEPEAEEVPEMVEEVVETPPTSKPEKVKRTRCAASRCRKLAKSGESYCTKHAKEK